MAVSETWNYTDIEQFYDRVRSLLDNISEVSLPDKYIDMREKAPFAEHYVKSKVDGWNSLDKEKTNMLESAIVYKTASFFESLVGANAIKKKELPTISLEYFARSEIRVNGMSLADTADFIISEINGYTENPFVGFVVTR